VVPLPELELAPELVPAPELVLLPELDIAVPESLLLAEPLVIASALDVLPPLVELLVAGLLPAVDAAATVLRASAGSCPVTSTAAISIQAARNNATAPPTTRRRISLTRAARAALIVRARSLDCVIVRLHGRVSECKARDQPAPLPSDDGEGRLRLA
jgi:hypothetical protein